MWGGFRACGRGGRTESSASTKRERITAGAGGREREPLEWDERLKNGRQARGEFKVFSYLSCCHFVTIYI